jgi:hypothetical protein
VAQGFPAPSGHLIYSQATTAVLDQACHVAHRPGPARLGIEGRLTSSA